MELYNFQSYNSLICGLSESQKQWNISQLNMESQQIT
jgi:hypothetical protein